MNFFTLPWYQPIIAVAAALVGLIVMFFESDSLLSGAVVTGLVAGVVSIAIALINNIFTRKNETDKTQLTLSDRLAELTQQERKELQGGLKELHDKEKKFLESQLLIERISNFESRRRAHRAVNEAHRVSGHIFILHSLMSKANLEIPAFEPKSYDQIMYGLAEEIEEYKKTLDIHISEV